MNPRKRLPIGIQTFRLIRDKKKNYVYVDKTETLYHLVDDVKYAFLSRPRRFGKSLFLDTLSELFKGSKELFEGLFIYENWDWNEKFPVIKIDLGSGDFSSKELIQFRLTEILKRNALHYGLDFSEIESHTLGGTFENLIYTLYRLHNQPIVVLIDEYDKPILDNIHRDDKSLATNAREILRSFYSVIKSSDEFLQFVFITGVSKFSKLNLFSGLNNLQDITIDARFATITGYSHQDLQTYFSDFLHDVDLELVKRWYNGYNYFGEPVYNPFDILLFLSNNNEFRNYWWETGNPQFLIEILKKQPYFLPELENIVVGSETLNAFDVEHIDLAALLWQTGYLTFDKKIRDGDFTFFKLKIPNLEIQKSLNHLFFDYLSNLGTKYASLFLQTRKSFNLADLDGFAAELRALFAAIPYQNYVNNQIGNFEGYYASVAYAFLASLGFGVIAEDTTNSGRIDMTLIGNEQIVILEFKVDMPAESALEQIKKKKYYEKYLVQGKTIYLMGIHFSSQSKNIENFEWEILKIDKL